MTNAADSAEQRVELVFAAIEKLDESDLMAMAGAWTGGDAALREEAWAKVRASAATGNDSRSKLLDASRDRLAEWVNDLGITWAGAYNRSIVVPNGADQGNLRRNAVPAILDAMIATLFADLLTDDEREELVEPLRRVTEPQPEAAE